jgi:tRNA threonylcarbamoyladenosine biosynthesis protein TsaE
MTGPRHGPGNSGRFRPPVAAEDLPTAPAGTARQEYVTSLPTPADTRAFGARLAPLLRAGDLVVLTGPLGAGKTALVQGIGAGLGVRGSVLSPTFVIARVHRGSLPLVHVDAYRLRSLAEVDDLDLDVDTEQSVTVVEWGAGLVEQLAEGHLSIELDRSAETETRTVRVVAHGGDWAARVAQLAQVASEPGSARP